MQNTARHTASMTITKPPTAMPTIAPVLRLESLESPDPAAAAVDPPPDTAMLGVVAAVGAEVAPLPPVLGVLVGFGLSVGS